MNWTPFVLETLAAATARPFGWVRVLTLGALMREDFGSRTKTPLKAWMPATSTPRVQMRYL